MAQQIEKLAHFVAETTLEQVPAEVQSYAKLVVLDTIGVVLAGAQRPEVRELRARLGATAGTGATVFAPGWPTNDPRTAGLLNGIAGRSIELGEGHRYVSYQGAMQILPGVLSAGEWGRRTGADMLAALILGYDAGARLGAAMKVRPLAHQNGQAALLGAAAAGARLRGLNGADTSRAMRIAATLVLTPLCMDLLLFKDPPCGAPRWWHPLGTLWVIVHLGGSQVFLYFVLRPILKLIAPAKADDALAAGKAERADEMIGNGIVVKGGHVAWPAKAGTTYQARSCAIRRSRQWLRSRWGRASHREVKASRLSQPSVRLEWPIV